MVLPAVLESVSSSAAVKHPQRALEGRPNPKTDNFFGHETCHVVPRYCGLTFGKADVYPGKAKTDGFYAPCSENRGPFSDFGTPQGQCEPCDLRLFHLNRPAGWGYYAAFDDEHPYGYCRKISPAKFAVLHAAYKGTSATWHKGAPGWTVVGVDDAGAGLEEEVYDYISGYPEEKGDVLRVCTQPAILFNLRGNGNNETVEVSCNGHVQRAELPNEPGKDFVFPLNGKDSAEVKITSVSSLAGAKDVFFRPGNDLDYYVSMGKPDDAGIWKSPHGDTGAALLDSWKCQGLQRYPGGKDVGDGNTRCNWVRAGIFAWDSSYYVKVEVKSPGVDWQLFQNYCVSADGTDLTQTHVADGDGAIEVCKSLCAYAGGCTGIEWYEANSEGSRCYHMKTETEKPAAKGSSGTQWKDAVCYVKVGVAFSGSGAFRSLLLSPVPFGGQGYVSGLKLKKSSERRCFDPSCTFS